MKKMIMLALFLPSLCFAEIRVSKQLSSGKILEMQSNATRGTIKQNAINVGIPTDDVTELTMIEAEYSAAMKAQ